MTTTATPEVRIVRASAAPEVGYKSTVADTADNGVIFGYASVFGVLDSMRDIVKPGAFSKTLERVKAGKVPLMMRHMAHGGDTAEVIGVIREAKEDARGLYIEAELNGSQVAQECREKVRTAPGMFGLSIGYSVVKREQINDANGEFLHNELKEVKLYEVTLTVAPANEETSAQAKTGLSLEALQAELVGLREQVEQLKAAKPNSTVPAPAAGNAPAPAAKTAAVHSRARALDRRLAIRRLESELTEATRGKARGNPRQDEVPHGRDREAGG